MTQNITWWFFFRDPCAWNKVHRTLSAHLEASTCAWFYHTKSMHWAQRMKNSKLLCRYIHDVPTTSQVHLRFINSSSTSTKQQITPSRPPGTGDLFVPRLPHVGQEEPGVHFAEDDVADWDHPESTCPSQGGVQALKVEKTISLVWVWSMDFLPTLGVVSAIFTP